MGNAGWVSRQRTVSALLGPGQSPRGYPSGKAPNKICTFCLEITSRCSIFTTYFKPKGSVATKQQCCIQTYQLLHAFWSTLAKQINAALSFTLLALLLKSLLCEYSCKNSMLIPNTFTLRIRAVARWIKDVYAASIILPDVAVTHIGNVNQTQIVNWSRK